MPRLRIESNQIVIPTQSQKTTLADVHFAVKSSTLITDLHIDAGPNWIVRTTNQHSTPTHRSFLISLRFIGAMSARTIDDHAFITPVLSDGIFDDANRKKVSISGQISRDVVVDRAVVHLGRRPLGESCKEAIVFRSLSNQHFTVLVPDTSRSLAITKDVMQNNVIYLTTTVSHLGAQEQTIIFRAVDCDKQAYDIPLVIRYYGID